MRLTRRPCPTCKDDTLHKGGLCLTCSHVTAAPIDTRLAKRKARIATLIGRRGKVAALNQLDTERRRHEFQAMQERVALGVRHRDRPTWPGKTGGSTAK